MEYEVLFRGKRLDNGEWVYGCLVESSGDVYRAYIVVAARWETDEDGNTDLIETEVYEVDPATVGQYTGLADKNGVKIFKGDILRTREWEGKKEAVVIFESGMFKAHGMSLVTWTINPGDYNCEVVGNVHDNPELLGGAE